MPSGIWRRASPGTGIMGPAPGACLSRVYGLKTIASSIPAGAATTILASISGGAVITNGSRGCGTTALTCGIGRGILTWFGRDPPLPGHHSGRHRESQTAGGHDDHQVSNRADRQRPPLFFCLEIIIEARSEIHLTLLSHTGDRLRMVRLSREKLLTMTSRRGTRLLLRPARGESHGRERP